MKKQRQKEAIPTNDRIRQSAFITVVCDVILIVALVICLLIYISRNNVNTYNQNVDNITNIAKAQSELMRVALDNTSFEVKSAYNYCSGMGLEDILDYLSVINPDGEYQLLKRDTETSTDLFHVYDG